MLLTSKRNEPIEGIIWKKDLEEIDNIYIDFRYYKVKDISDLKYFKNIRSLWLSYSNSNGNTDIYGEEGILENLYKIKNFKHLENIHLYHLKINEDIEAMFPGVNVFID